MKRVILCAALLFFMAGCREAEGIAAGCIEKAELTRPEGAVEADWEQYTLQENLAMWYNLNLLEENDPEYRMAYDTILFYSDGVMGSLEIPGQEIHLPIYHGKEGKGGFGHDPDTAFPIGQTGIHPVLVTDMEIGLNPDDTFVIHILGKDLCYRVAAVRRQWDTSAVPGVDYCSLILGNKTQVLAVRTD